MRHLALVPVLLRPDNLSGESHDFDVIVGVAAASTAATYSTWPTTLEPGTVVAGVTSADGDPFMSGELYEVTAGPLNQLDEQPAVGDEVLFTVSPYANLFASGMLLEVVNGPDGSNRWVHPATGLVLAMYPILAGELWAQVGQLGARVQLIEGFLQDLAATLAASPLTPDDLPVPTPTDLPLVTPAGEPVAEPAPIEPATPEIPTFGQDTPVDIDADIDADTEPADGAETPAVPGDEADTTEDTEAVADVAEPVLEDAPEAVESEAPEAEPEVIPVDVVADGTLPEAGDEPVAGEPVDAGEAIDAPADGTETELPATPESTGDSAFGLADPVPADPIADPTATTTTSEEPTT